MPDFGHDFKAMRAAVTDHTRLLFVAVRTIRPDSNTEAGQSNWQSLPEHVILCLDEAYVEYLKAPQIYEDKKRLKERLYACELFPRRRIGRLKGCCGYGDPKLIQLLQRVRQPFNVSLRFRRCGDGAQ